MCKAKIFSSKVTVNNISPNAKAASVLGLSNSWSPVSRVTICTVTVVTDSNGFAVNFAASPAAITTIIVSPIARDIASIIPPTIPGSAAGITTFRMVSDCVAPMAKEPSRMDCGTAVITSSAREEIKGIIIIPITPPAASALSDEIVKPTLAPKSRKKGATVNAAKNP